MPNRIRSSPSPAAERSKKYFDGRDFRSLEWVGALKKPQTDLLKRIEDMPGATYDRHVQLDELERFDRPDYRGALLPSEEALRPEIWKALEWESSAPASPQAPLPSLDSLVSDRSLPVRGYQPGKSFPVSSLPPELQTLAARIEQVRNGDRKSSTVSITDALEAMKRPFFTADEKKQLQTLVDLLAAKQPAPFRSVLEVPKPGTTSRTLLDSAGAKMSLVSTVSIKEERALADRPYPYGYGERSQALSIQRESSVQLSLPEGRQAILVNIDTGADHVPDGNGKVAVTPGNWRLEQYENGKRVAVGDFIVPPFERQESKDLSKYVDYTLTSGGRALERNLTSARKKTSSSSERDPAATAQWEFSTQAKPPSAALLRSYTSDVAELVTASDPGLAPGRYTVAPKNGPAYAMEVLPNRVILVDVGGEKVRLTQNTFEGEFRGKASDGKHYTWDPRAKTMSSAFGQEWKELVAVRSQDRVR